MVSVAVGVSDVIFAEEGITLNGSITSPSDSSRTLFLAGHGLELKVKDNVEVKVARFAIYLEREVTSHLQAWKGKPAEELSQDSAFFAALIKAPVEKFVKVVLLVGPLTGAQYGAQVEAVVKERLIKDKKLGEAEERALKELSDFFQPINQLGSTVFYTVSSPSIVKLTVHADGAEVVHIISGETTVSALLDTVLGQNTLSPSTVASLVQGIASWLN